MKSLKIFLLTLIITFSFGFLAINYSHADSDGQKPTLYNNNRDNIVKPIPVRRDARCKIQINSTGKKVTVCDQDEAKEVENELKESDTTSNESETTTRPITQKVGQCKVIIDKNQQKKIFCDTQDTLIKLLPTDTSGILPIFEKRKISDIKNTDKQSDENKSLLEKKREKLEAHKIEIHDFKTRLENYKENLKDNRETLNQAFKEKREALKTEVKALGKDGLVKLAQDKDKRKIITELQIEQLRLRIMANFERVANLGNRLSDIVDRIQKRIEIINTENEKDTSKAEELMNSAQELLQTLDTKISNATNDLNQNDVTLQTLKETGQKNLKEIKTILLNTKEKIRETIQALKA